MRNSKTAMTEKTALLQFTMTFLVLLRILQHQLRWWGNEIFSVYSAKNGKITEKHENYQAAGKSTSSAINETNEKKVNLGA